MRFVVLTDEVVRANHSTLLLCTYASVLKAAHHPAEWLFPSRETSREKESEMEKAMVYGGLSERLK